MNRVDDEDMKYSKGGLWVGRMVIVGYLFVFGFKHFEDKGFECDEVVGDSTSLAGEAKYEY